MADMVELVDTWDSKSHEGNFVTVQARLSAHLEILHSIFKLIQILYNFSLYKTIIIV